MGAVTGLPAAVGGAALGSGLGQVAMGPTGALTGGALGGIGGLTGKIPTNLGGGIGAMTGTAGGAGGTGFAKPELANIQAPLTPEQVQGMQGTANGAISSQQAFLDAVKGNTGNLNNVYGQGQGMYGQLAGANGTGIQTGAVGNLQGILGQQANLAGQYGAIARGEGPNPAQNMLNQATGANVANQAALMAGQRGAGANVGLMARQAGQQGAATQQQAAGQAATMQSQQQLAAMQAQGAQQQAMGNTAGQMAGIGQGLTSAQMAQLGANAGIAQQQIGNEAGAQNQVAGNAIANAGQGLGAQTAFNQAQVGNQNSVNTANAGLANTGMQGQQAMVGGLMNAAGPGIKTLLAEGGEATSAPVTAAPPVVAEPGAQSSFGQFLSKFGEGMTTPASGDSLPWQTKALYDGASNLGKSLFSGKDKSSDMTPGGYAGSDISDLSSDTMVAAAGGEADMRSGGPVAAASERQKAEKGGDSYANDKIPAVLSEKEIVLPRSVTMSANAPEAAARFVAAVQARKAKGRKAMADGGAPEEAPEAEAAPQAPAEQPAPTAGAQDNVIQVRAPDTLRMPRIIVPNAQQMDAETAAQAQDMASGRIKPMTYGEAAGKGTMGKIGTFFGLLLSGAGSGLAHQPNALLDMMNKEIERDYNAQVASQNNKQGWYRLSLDHTRQKYDNALSQSQTNLSDAQRQVQEQVMGREAFATGLNLFRMQMMGVDVQKFINGLPPGPTREQAQAMFETQVKPYIGAQNSQTNAKAAGQAGLIAAAHDAKNPPKKNAGPTVDDPVDLKKLDRLYQAYQIGEGLPGGAVPGMGFDKSDIQSASQEAAGVKELFTAQKHVNDAWEKLDQAALAGETVPGLRDTVLADLKPIVAKLAGSNTVTEMENVAKNFPEPKDLPTLRAQKAKFIHGLFERALSGMAPTIRRMEGRGSVGKLIADLPPPPRVAKGKDAAPEQRAMGAVVNVAKKAANAAADAVSGGDDKPPANAKEGDTWKNGKGVEYKREHGGWRKAK